MSGAEKTTHSCLSGLLACQHTKTIDNIEILHVTNRRNNYIVNYTGLAANLCRLQELPVKHLAKTTNPCRILPNDHAFVTPV